MGGKAKNSRYFDTFDILGTRKGMKAEEEAKKSQREATEAIGKQKQLENVKLAEEEDLLGRKKAQRKSGGRSLLMASSSPAGNVSNLGGTE